MIKKMLFLVMIITGTLAVHACVDPDYVFGILFNGGEAVDTGIIAEIGEEGVNYLVDDGGGEPEAYYHVDIGNVYTFRGHFMPSVMISLSTTGMRFVVDTAVVRLDDFEFGRCIRIELDWLFEAGILAMDRLEREEVELAFNRYGGKSSYYWTEQDSLLQSSLLFDTSGVLQSINCVGAEFAEVDLPPQSLVLTMHTLHPAKNQRPIISAGRRSITGVAVNGRVLFRSGADDRTAGRSGVVLLYDRNRRSGVAKRIVQLP
jgi:hypothetical protein